MSEGLDRIQSGGLISGVNSEEEADGDGDGHRDYHDIGRDSGRYLLTADTDIGDKERAEPPGEQADKASDKAKDSGLGEELEEDIASFGSDSLTDTDFSDSFGDRDEHDIHNTDTADNQRDTGDKTEEYGKYTHYLIQ